MTCFEYLTEGKWLGYNYYTPEVLVSFDGADGPVNIVMEVDSGAAISLLPRSAVELLGLDYYAGVPVNLSGVGGATFVAFVHVLSGYIGDERIEIPVAIAPTESFPPLLGRLGLYDQKDVFMDNVNKSVCVGAVGEALPHPVLASEVPPVAVLVLLGIFLLIGMSEVR